MLSHRPYMRGDYQREKTSGLTWLLSAIIAGFILQLVLGAAWLSGARNSLNNLFALTIPGFQDGWLWTLVTHSFLHSTTFIFHVVVNCLALYFLGRELVPMLGTKRFMALYGVATVVGALAWAAVHWRFGSGELIGASAAIDALVVLFACFFPNQPISFLLLFVFPVTLRPKYIAGTLAVFDLLLLLFLELPGTKFPFDMTISSSAHLGGMLTGLLYYRYVHQAGWFNPLDRPDVELPRWIRRAKKMSAISSVPELNIAPPAASPDEIRAEVNRILDKINSDGFSALTPAERQVLDDAKHILSRP